MEPPLRPGTCVLEISNDKLKWITVEFRIFPYGWEKNVICLELSHPRENMASRYVRLRYVDSYSHYIALRRIEVFGKVTEQA